MITQTVTITQNATPNIIIGRRGTYETKQVIFDVSWLRSSYGEGTATLLVKRPTDVTAYPVAATLDGTTLTWTVSDTDTSYKGHGECEIFWYVNGGLAKSCICGVTILRDIGDATETAPDPYETWIETLTALGSETLANAQSAAQSASDANQSAEDASNSAAAALESEENALNSENAAKASEQAAAASEANALASEQAAKASENAAALSEGNARQSANAAYQSAGIAANSATQAATSASEAQGYVSEASVQADRAEQAADNIESNVQRAEAAAQSAQNAASDANGFAGAASTKATEAAASASSASSSAVAATQKASDASASATAAASSATAANTAKAAAETAHGKAEDAQEAAETAATNAQASADDAAQSAQEAAREIIKAFPHDTASGSIANFPDGAALPVRDLSVDIEPVQGLNGYDNPWPGGGGKNKFDLSIIANVSAAMRRVTLTLKPNTTYTMSTDQPLYNGMTANIFFHLAGESESTGTNGVSVRASRTLTTGDDGIAVVAYRLGGWSSSEYLAFHYQIEEGSSATAYSPYSNICPISGWTGANIHVSPTTDAEDGTTYSITFPTEAGTVYGGTLDVATGKLTVDRAYYLFDGSTDEEWSKQSSGNYYQIPCIPGGGSQYGTGVSNMFAWTQDSVNNPPNTIRLNSAKKYIFLINPSIANSLDDLKTYLSTNNLQVTYKLATPIVYDLTPTEVSTLLGTNNIFADCGDTTVDYYADPTLFVNKKIAAAVAAMS